MEKHKSKALEEGCICNDCPLKFACFTQEKIFSETIHQSLFEAYIADGMSRSEALVSIIHMLEETIRSKKDIDFNDFYKSNIPKPYVAPRITWVGNDTLFPNVGNTTGYMTSKSDTEKVSLH